MISFLFRVVGYHTARAGGRRISGRPGHETFTPYDFSVGPAGREVKSYFRIFALSPRKPAAVRSAWTMKSFLVVM